MELAWRPDVLRHPRLVFDSVGPDEEALIWYYLATGKPFTVVVGDARATKTADPE